MSYPPHIWTFTKANLINIIDNLAFNQIENLYLLAYNQNGNAITANGTPPAPLTRPLFFGFDSFGGIYQETLGLGSMLTDKNDLHWMAWGISRSLGANSLTEILGKFPSSSSDTTNGLLILDNLDLVDDIYNTNTRFWFDTVNNDSTQWLSVSSKIDRMLNGAVNNFPPKTQELRDTWSAAPGGGSWQYSHGGAKFHSAGCGKSKNRLTREQIRELILKARAARSEQVIKPKPKPK
jgi:hypothetical protein